MGRRVPFERPLQLFDHPTEQQRAGGAQRNFGGAYRGLPGANTFQKVSRMAIAVVKMNFVRAQRLLDDVRRVGNQIVAIHGDAPACADKTRAAVAAHRFARIRFAIDHDAAGVLVTGAILLHE